MSGLSPYAACSIGRDRTVYRNAEVEPQIAVNPTTVGTPYVNLLAVWQQDRFRSGSARGIAAAASFDGGRSWSETTLAFSSCAKGGLPYKGASDPWVSFGADGVAYASAVALNLGPGVGTAASHAIVVATSQDGGRKWSSPRVVVTNVTYQDKPAITADPRKPGAAYLVWQGTVGGRGIGAWFSRTTNGGKTWSQPEPILHGIPGASSDGNQILVDPRRGVLYDIFDLLTTASRAPRICGRVQEHQRCHVFSAAPGTSPGAPVLVTKVASLRSTDGGLSWSPPQIIALDLGVPVAVRGLGAIRTGANLPEAAINLESGKLYVVWQDARFTVGLADEIAISSSVDGIHWTSPLPIGGSVQGPAFTPSVAVNSRAEVGLTYYQLHSVAKGQRTLLTDYWFRASTDGLHFGKPEHIAGPFDMATAPFAGGYFLGDYEGIVAVRNAFQSLFVMTNAETKTNPTDVFSKAIKP